MTNRRGQTLMIFAVTTLLLGAMVLMTIAFGVRAKRKMELQAVADAAALSNATAAARTYNVAALMNRTAVSHWVAMAGVQALTAYGSTVAAYLGEYAGMSYGFQTPNAGCRCSSTGRPPDPVYDSAQNCWECWEFGGPASPGDAGCTARTWQTRDAFYNFQHARLALFNRGGGEIDNPVLGTACNSQASLASCAGQNLRAPGQPWDARAFEGGIGELDREVADQARSIRSAIHNLMSIQVHTWRELEKVLNDQDLTETLLKKSQGYTGSGLPPGLRVDGKTRGGMDVNGVRRGRFHESWREVANAATEVKDSTPTRDPAFHMRAMSQAIRGTTGRLFPLEMANDRGQRLPPQAVLDIVAMIQRNVDAVHPNRFRFFPPTDLTGCAFMSDGSATLDNCKTSTVDVPTDLGLEEAFGAMRDMVRVSYRDPCTGQTRTKIGEVEAIIRTRARDSVHYGNSDNMAGYYGGCHAPGHGYWNGNREADHNLNPAWETPSGPVGLAFIFANDGRGPRGAEGQPKVPVMLRRTRSASDPWNIVVPARVVGGASTRELTIDGRNYNSGEEAEQAVVSNGIVYYHRYGQWREPANLLNPFWRSTLVPANTDAVDGDAAANDRTDEMLFQNDERTAGRLYRRLKAMTPPFRGIQ